MTHLQNAKELSLLQTRRDAAKLTGSLAFGAWLDTLDRIRMRVASGALTKTERKLSLAAIAIIEEELDRVWHSLQESSPSERGSEAVGSDDANGVRERILDELVKLRVALTANFNQTERSDG